MKVELTKDQLESLRFFTLTYEIDAKEAPELNAERLALFNLFKNLTVSDTTCSYCEASEWLHCKHTEGGSWCGDCAKYCDDCGEDFRTA